MKNKRGAEKKREEGPLWVGFGQIQPTRSPPAALLPLTARRKAWASAQTAIAALVAKKRMGASVAGGI